jgi:hypothetical protein
MSVGLCRLGWHRLYKGDCIAVAALLLFQWQHRVTIVLLYWLFLAVLLTPSLLIFGYFSASLRDFQ